MTAGAWTRRTSGRKASGVTCIERWIPPAPPSISFSRPSRTQPRLSAFSPKRWAERTIPLLGINTDGHAAYPSAVAQLKGEGDLSEDCRHRPVPYLNNVLEQDHRAIKRRVNASQHFRSFSAARRTLAAYEAIHMIRKSQASGSASAPGIGLLHRFFLRLFGATREIFDQLSRPSVR